jgi:hypothetical protein
MRGEELARAVDELVDRAVDTAAAAARGEQAASRPATPAEAHSGPEDLALSTVARKLFAIFSALGSRLTSGHPTPKEHVQWAP